MKEEALPSLYDAKVIIFYDICNSMRQELRNKYLSVPRYNRYLIATGNSSKKAKRLYHANLRLAQAFHPVLIQFEVVFRNSLNNQLSNHFGVNDWIITEKTGFMSAPSLRPSNYFLRQQVQQIENGLRRRGVRITSDKIIAEQTFGFWAALFSRHHYSLLQGQPIRIFPYKPRTERRASIYAKIETVRKFRNRANHCEPLCFSGNQIDCTNAVEVRNAIYDLVSWIEPDLVAFFQDLDNIPNKVQLIDNI